MQSKSGSQTGFGHQAPKNFKVGFGTIGTTFLILFSNIGLKLSYFRSLTRQAYITNTNYITIDYLVPLLIDRSLFADILGKNNGRVL